MKKNTKIAIGLIAAVGIGYLIYKNQKDKSVSSGLTDAEKLKAEQAEAALSAQPEAEQRLIYSQDVSDLINMLNSTDYVELSFDGALTNAQRNQVVARTLEKNTDASLVTNTTLISQSFDDNMRKQVSDKLKNLVAKNALTTEDLKTIHDFVLAKKKKYPGKKSKGELNSSLRSIFHRYGLDLPEAGKRAESSGKKFLGISIPDIKLPKRDSIVEHQAMIK